MNIIALELESMQKNPTFSIIVPTYNAERYIARCLESCINQTFDDIEILIIDDCGNDRSIEIAKTYANRDSRISIIHNPHNLGTFASRLEGIKYAQGHYTLMLDADDYLVLNACEVLAPYLLNSPDIIHFKALYLGDKNASLSANIMHKMRYILPTQWSAKPLKDSQIAYNFFLKSKHFPKSTIWDKCYKTSLAKQALPYLQDYQTPLNMAEDMLKFFVLANLAKSYLSVNSRLYVYCLNAASITQSPNAHTKRIYNMYYIIEILKEIGFKIHTPHATTIAQTMISHLHALIILESRFSEIPIECIEGGGHTRFAKSYVAKITILTILHLFTQVLESFTYLCAYCCLYPKHWDNKTLKSKSKSASFYNYFYHFLGVA